ncbi:M1 family metallopeptidase [Reichenbachiella carrageenanivorans]|uniref:M1 family metallopeptidase n=1 Tax=Reichenbachiella carrageenanivorans TaxID=2979869 RepID=A0ABY6D453_9BACT|nr:M1 family metallopeptidase [Reichenbachiella carrageenanivorans]UXX80941.1 M1 family metallopeptidase [Reichenbachiella carrageenanivorans]
MKRNLIWVLIMSPMFAFAQGEWNQKFEQLGTTLPTANSYRNASGAPGVDYWQQRADYTIAAELNDDNQSLTGRETVTYYNNSPDNLTYLWVQLDQNMRSKTSDTPLVEGSEMKEAMTGKQVLNISRDYDFDGGFKISEVSDAAGKPLKHMINKTMMRIDLPKSLANGEQFVFNIAWSYNVQDRMELGGRSGYEFFPKDGNYLYTIAQWFPRMAVYDDVEGWQNKQFLGRGEFALEFGDYKVRLTVPSDFVVASTGELQNADQVLTKTQKARLAEAKKTFDKPVMIVTEAEARKAEATKAKGTKTWEYHADDVRDFAFAASRKFIWDAQAVQLETKTPMAMSYYPKEGNPLWEDESTKAVANTLRTYSKHTIEYPYPVAISVHTASIGMEYPMICFNYGRPNEDGTFTDAKKWGMIGVIIHEVGHNFFPMIINSDERQWTWMDEGLNTFTQSLTEKEYYLEKPLKRGEAKLIVDYMKGDKEGMRPIMTNSEQILQFGNNAYGKPAAALSVLRETVMGPELFDYAFKTYAERWAFKHPSPADFFRTMEDASAVDLDWFWKGWFYTTDHVDISLSKVKWYRMDIPENEVENKSKKAKKSKISAEEENKNLMDFADEAEVFTYKGVNEAAESARASEFLNQVDDAAIKSANANRNFYELTFENKGGLVMPIIIEWTYEDGTVETEFLPAEIWKKNENVVTKVFAKEKKVTNIVIDPNEETADVATANNVFPRVEDNSRFDQFQKGAE